MSEKPKSLLALTSEMEMLDAALSDIDGEIDDAALVGHLADLREATDEAFQQKVSDYCALIREKELKTSALEAEEDRITMRIRQENRDVTWLKNVLKQVMTQRGLTKAGKLRMASVCGNGGKQPVRLLVEDPADLPPAYQLCSIVVTGEQRQALAPHMAVAGIRPLDESVDANTERIRAELEIAPIGAIDGVATLEPRGTHLRIR